MRLGIRILAGTLAGTLLWLASARAAERPLLEVRTQTSRSALWVGDRFHYVVSVLHDPDVRFVSDNLQRSTLNLDPFQVLDLQYQDRPAAGGRQILEIDLLLTAYEPKPGQLEIPSFSLFYFVEASSVTPGADRPAETLAVPATPVAIRSTLPEEVSSIRDAPVPPPARFRHQAARPLAVGLFGLALALVLPVLFHGRKLRTAQEVLRRRKEARDKLQASLSRVASLSVDSEERVLHFYEEIYGHLRAYLSEVSPVATEGKTGRELAALFSAGAPSLDGLPEGLLGEIPSLVETCEQVRYAPNGSVLGMEQHAAVVERLRAVVNGAG